MSIFRRKKQTDAETESLKSFLDMIAPSIVKFETGYYICGNTFRCIWALREYPTSTDDLAILRHLGEKHGVTLHIYTRMVSPLEERKIVHNAEIRNRMNRGSAQDMQRAVEAESNLQDVANLIGSLHRNKEPLLHCAVYIEMIAGDMQELQILQTNVEVELMRSKLNVDRLKLCQQAGFCAVSPVGFNAFGTEYERVLPASSVANLFPFNYSGKTDRKGFYIGKDKYGSNIVVDFDQRDEDKTSANVLILGNSGQGKSYLMKLLLLNFLEAGKSVITLDVEHEQWELCQALGGCFADIIEGTYKINLLEPRCWDTDADPYDVDAPKAFRQSTRLAQHTSFLKDVFRTYKDFTTAQIDTIEIMLTKLYTEWGITEDTDFSQMRPEDYPILSELYDFIEIEYENFDETKPQLYTRETLQQILLGLHSMCRGADSKFFNGHTNLTSTRFLVFGVKGLLSVAQNVRSTILLNLLSYMSDKLLTEGNTVAALDELYIWLSNPVAIEYIRNSLKRVRKKESALVLASQNLEDFDQPGVREMTKPLFSIPPHQFLFNAGSIDRRAYMDMLQLEDSEFDLIKFPQRGVCLYKCGNERYLLEVHAPPYKEALFGKAGGR
ncbi:MAG: VirB4 family type IV secretion system protein [Oscillospiraceae bacterium]